MVRGGCALEKKKKKSSSLPLAAVVWAKSFSDGRAAESFARDCYSRLGISAE